MSGITTVTKIRYNPRGVYGANITYGIDDMVYHAGSYYRCVVDETIGTQPTLYDQNNSPWEKVSTMPYSQGEWASGTTYYAGDIVGVTSTYYHDYIYDWQDSDSYICLNVSGVTGNSNYPPNSSNNWMKISTGNMSKKRAFLTRVDGLTSPGKDTEINYRKLWDARSGALSNEYGGDDRGYAAGGVGIVTLTSGGSGYSTQIGYPAGLSTATVAFSGGGGAGASGVAYVNANGTIRAIEITDPGQGYSGAVTVSVTGGHDVGGGTNATATAYAYPDKRAPGDYQNIWKTDDGSASFQYVNRRYGLMAGGYSDGVNTYFGHSGGPTGGANAIHECSFIHNDWMEGLLPTPDGLPPKVVQVCQFYQYGMLVLFNNGEVHYAGYNAHGQAGDSTTTVKTGFVRCGYANVNKSGNTALRGKKAIRIASTGETGNGASAGNANFALIENPDGSREVWGWGYTADGIFAQGNNTNQTTPIKIFDEASPKGANSSGGPKIIGLWAAGGTSGQLFVLCDNGEMFCSGHNSNGNLGVNDNVDKGNGSGINAGFYSQQDGGGGAIPYWTGDYAIRYFKSSSSGANTIYYIVTDNGQLWMWGQANQNYSGHGTVITDAYAPIRLSANGITGSAGNYTVNPTAGFTTEGTSYGESGQYVTGFWPGGSYTTNTSYYMSIAQSSTYKDLNFAERSEIAGITTAVSTGINGARQLSIGAGVGVAANDNTTRNTFVGFSTDIGYQAKDVVDFATQHRNTGYTQGIFRCHHKNRVVHYVLPYNNYSVGGDVSNAYNINQRHDTAYLASNYQAKPVRLYFDPKFAEDERFLKYMAVNANSDGYHWQIAADMTCGRLYISVSNSSADYGVQSEKSEGRLEQFFKLAYH